MNHAEAPDPRRWRILGVTLTVGFMSLLDVTIVNVALPSIQQGLQATAGTVQWVVSGYALTFALTLVIGGRLGDAVGRRRMMLIGLTAFVAASAAVGFAPTPAVVVAARLAQGAAAGLLTPQSSGIIQELFSGPERGRAFGAFGFVVGVSSAIGPILGGLIIALFGAQHGWRYIFLINLPIGVVALYFIARLVPGRRPGQQDKPVDLDIVGALLLGLTMLAVLYPLIAVIEDAEQWLLLLLLVPVFAFLFVRRERSVIARGREPLLDLQLLKETRGYSNGLLIGLVYFTGFTGIFLVLTVCLQDQYGLSALQVGLLVTPFAAGSAVAAPFAGRIVSVLGRRLTVFALCTMILGTCLLIAVVPDGPSRSWLFFAAALLIAGLGGGAVISPNFTLTLENVPTRMAGAAGGALQTSQRVGSAIGTALLMCIYTATLGNGISAQRALRVSLAAAVVLLSLALAVAIRDARRAEPAL